MVQLARRQHESSWADKKVKAHKHSLNLNDFRLEIMKWHDMF